MKPGHTVVTAIPSFASSVRIPSEKPVKANLLAQYANICGETTLPLMEEILTMRPACR
jgi:hypothetical protein